MRHSACRIAAIGPHWHPKWRLLPGCNSLQQSVSGLAWHGQYHLPVLAGVELIMERVLCRLMDGLLVTAPQYSEAFPPSSGAQCGHLLPFACQNDQLEPCHLCPSNLCGQVHPGFLETAGEPSRSRRDVEGAPGKSKVLLMTCAFELWFLFLRDET